MANLLYSNLHKSTFNFSPLSLPLSLSPPKFSINRFYPLSRRFYQSSLPAKLSSDSSQLDIISRTEHSDGTVSFKFGDPSEVSQALENIDSLNDVELEREGSSGLDNQNVSVVDDESDSSMAEKIIVTSVKLKEIGTDSSDSLVEEDDQDTNSSSVGEELENSSVSSVDDESSRYSSSAGEELENSNVSLVDDESSCNSSSAGEELENLSVSSVDDKPECNSSLVEVVEDSSDFKVVKNDDEVGKPDLIVEEAEELGVASVELSDVAEAANDDKTEYSGDESLASIVSEEMRDGGRLESGGDELASNVEASDVVVSLNDVIIESELNNAAASGGGGANKVENSENEPSSISYVEASDGGKLEYVGDETVSKISDLIPNLDASEVAVSLKDDGDEDSSFHSIDDARVTGQSLGSVNGKVHDTATDSISESDDLSDVVSADPVTSRLTSAETSLDSLNERQTSAPAIFTTSAGASLSHSVEALAGGKDAYFISEDWFGVADGVGQWSLEGVDIGLYPHELMQNCEKLLKSMNSGTSNVKELLKQTDAITESTGSARVIVAHVANQVLHVANIGDSGFVVIRNGIVYKKSSPMVHEFGFPYAIGLGDDSLEDIEEYHVELEDGDVIVTATDGLFDNLYEEEIASIVSKGLEDGMHIQEIAELLGTTAQEVGKSESARSPFADAAQAAGHAGYSGGKHDHVTVIVSLVQTR